MRSELHMVDGVMLVKQGHLHSSGYFIHISMLSTGFYYDHSRK